MTDASAGDGTVLAGTLPLAQGFVAPPLAGIDIVEPDQTLFGTIRPDRLIGAGGNDTIEGFNANDLLYGNGGNDYLTGDQGNDTLYGGDGDDHFFGGAERDRLWGETGNNELLGYGDEDRLIGGLGNDTLLGGDGKDTLWGGQGADSMFGGLGADVFQFKNATESGVTFATLDKIEDYENSIDQIHLGLIDANANRTGNQAFRFAATGAFDGGGGSLQVITRNGDTLVMADFNGDKVADVTIKLEGLHSLSASDFNL